MAEENKTEKRGIIFSCVPAIEQMKLVNNTLGPYATKYYLPCDTEKTLCTFSRNEEKDCPFPFFCRRSDLHEEHFKNPSYPNHLNELIVNGSHDAEEIKIINRIISASKEFGRHYGYYSSNDGSIGIDHARFSASDSDEDNKLASRLIQHLWDDYRTLFCREYDRILCTPAFRHLQYKTQVMVNSASDDQRTRLMHSLEVQRIAKKIALGIHVNWELTDTISIAHDIGHTPFGHEGENEIRKYLSERRCGFFSHAMQSVKVLDDLSEHPILIQYGIHGLALSSFVLEGVLKHDADTFTDGMQNAEFMQQYDVSSYCGIVGENLKDCTKALEDYLTNTFKSKTEKPKIPQVLIGSVESQVVAWADKIAYLGHDWEEFIDTGLLEKMMERINVMVLKMKELSEKGKPKDSDGPNDGEIEHIGVIWNQLKIISNYYDTKDEDSPKKPEEKWESVRESIETIIESLKKITDNRIITKDSADPFNGYYKYFSEREYSALKNYFVMVASWVGLLDTYPETYGLKVDPIYVFFQFLTKVRSNIISPKVSELIIRQTNDYIRKINNKDIENDLPENPERFHYLIHCNKLWAHKYRLLSKAGEDPKATRKLLKKSLRTCFLVGFHDSVEFDATGHQEDYDYIVGRKNIPSCGYDFDQKYNCMLNIFDVTFDEFIQSTRVKFMSHTAQKIIKELLDYYFAHPDMLPFEYRKRYNERHFALALKDSIPEVSQQKYSAHAMRCRARIAADYVATLTDRMAKKKYDELMSSESEWSNSFTNDLT